MYLQSAREEISDRVFNNNFHFATLDVIITNYSSAEGKIRRLEFMWDNKKYTSEILPAIPAEDIMLSQKAKVVYDSEKKRVLALAIEGNSYSDLDALKTVFEKNRSVSLGGWDVHYRVFEKGFIESEDVRKCYHRPLALIETVRDIIKKGHEITLIKAYSDE